MWHSERARRLSLQPLRWAGDTDPGYCERCGANGAVPTALFVTAVIAYDLCDGCWADLESRKSGGDYLTFAWYKSVAFHARQRT
jgi:hypothetical protein